MNEKSTIFTKEDRIRMQYENPLLCTLMSDRIVSWLPKFPREYVVVFIGTDRSTGDALGPLAGSLFTKMNPKYFSIYGTLHKPVHAQNLNEYIQMIKQNHHTPFIIAVDACLGKINSVGHLIAGMGPLKPGAALNKNLPAIGDIYLTGVVNISGYMEYSILQNTRLSIVTDMAHKVADTLCKIDQRLTHLRIQPAIVSSCSNKKTI